ncbi:MAG: formylglycine-generating enzyme family protein, partial [Candidatus Promineifilaceae bacterium]
HLAQLGDPRPEVMDLDAMHFCYVPAGDFVMGEGKEEHPQTGLDYDYWLGRFPVTQAQYGVFVAEGGYGQKEWWAEAIAANAWEGGAYTAYGDRRTGPRDYGRSFQFSNLPVVGVSWYEALAFCHWLTARWQKQGILPQDWQVMLPSEAEWEKAARGGLHIPGQPLVQPAQTVAATAAGNLATAVNPNPRRAYPWLEEKLTPEMANYDKSDINQTSSVGGYRTAVSAYGCEELIGNVWEWTRSLKKEYPYVAGDGREKLARGQWDSTVLRGGSWGSHESYQRCSARLYYLPDLVDAFYGFRLALSPFFDSGRW